MVAAHLTRSWAACNGIPLRPEFGGPWEDMMDGCSLRSCEETWPHPGKLGCGPLWCWTHV